MNRGPRGQITASPVLVGEALLYWSVYYRHMTYTGTSTCGGTKAGMQAMAQGLTSRATKEQIAALAWLAPIIGVIDVEKTIIEATRNLFILNTHFHWLTSPISIYICLIIKPM